jgi:hypothetical protein
MQQNLSHGAGKGQAGPLPPPEHKVAYVREMFGRIAGRYDLMNCLMTFGRDRSWRRYTVSQLGMGNGQASTVLDVATGTGDLAIEALPTSGPNPSFYRPEMPCSFPSPMPCSTRW